MKIDTMALTVEVSEINRIKKLLQEVKASGGKTIDLDLIETIEKSLDKLNKENAAMELAGKTAGICYMKDDYFSKGSSEGENAIKRGKATIGLGHHSIGDHGNITLLLGEIPKVVAMILNNTRYYTTSEKSARYTEMKPETKLELDLYNKWNKLFYTLMEDKYPKLDSNTVDKLAKENARYLISVFTPTTMAYTTSYRQISYIMDWCDKIKDNLRVRGFTGEFYGNLVKELQVFKEALINEVDIQLCYDIKNRGFDLLLDKKPDNKEIIDDVYMFKYKASFAELAQAQRHRTITYQMYFDNDNIDYYVPKIIRETNYEIEWINDMESVSYCIPQGILLDVVERGTVENFILKAKERMCGRAQLEICDITTRQMQKFIDNKDKLSKGNQDLIDRHTKKNEVCTKCLMDGFKCKEVCYWGSRDGLTRII